MNAEARKQLFAGYAQMSDTHTALAHRIRSVPYTGPLTLPLTAKDNRLIFDAEGHLVSIPERAQWFAEGVNILHEIRMGGAVSASLWDRIMKWAAE